MGTGKTTSNREDAEVLQNESFEALVQSVVDYAIFALDRNGFVSTWNAGAQRIKGYTADEILGKHFSTFYSQEAIDLGHPEHELKVAAETGRFEEEGMRLRKDGTMFWANVVLTALYDKNHKVKGFLKVTRDITDRKNAEQQQKKLNSELELRVLERTSQLELRERELEFAKDQAEKANAAKSTFLANMSHEIRTPLGAILGFSEMITEDGASPEEKETAKEAILRNGHLLMNLINDVLDLSKIEAHKMEIEKSRIRFNDLKEELSATFTSPSRTKGIGFDLSFASELPETLVTDPVRLKQILYNLIGNAIKFTDSGNVTIKVYPRGKEFVSFAITDTGIGIAEEQQQILFSPFQQADSSITRSFGGTGLGLVLSRSLAQALGGDLDLSKSALKEGSTFVLTIPIVDKNAPVDEVPVYNGTNTDKIAAKILVVDDNADNRRLLSILLRKNHYVVETAGDGIECLEKLPVFEPNLVLMDLQMPRMDGITTATEMKRRHYRTPVIALTANALKEEKERCLGLGFAEYLTKPINKTQIEQAIQRNLVTVR
ncbi:response regulator [Bdellovibrio sp. KM01]|uniref:PAS domain-containing hybrid sensor histidine kinase/response regulator n=1 Tax=Bdellovibrio sp. KM01 TaxID=2748865 RepID=UPI0015E967AC|nr:response regulator [Bdellovibrio sp. KM01]QLY24122.1 response regulator [Bdellovibrio sp. KM01]